MELDYNQLCSMLDDDDSTAAIKTLLDQAICLEDVNGGVVKILKLKDATIPDFLLTGEKVVKVRDIRHRALREDDVIVCSYPKTGTHWICSLIHLIIQKVPLDDAAPYIMKVIDLIAPEIIDESPSPRVLACHRRPYHLPEDVFKMKKKVVLICRNPKDTLVSHFHHHKKLYLNLAWNTFVECWIKGLIPFDDFFEFYNAWEREIEHNKELDVLVVLYDKMLKNDLEELRRIQEFLGYSHSDEHLLKILDECSIANLRHKSETGQTPTPLTKDGKSIIFRKGIIGDWKNHFTVAQSEKCDAVIKQKLRKGTIVPV